jgi:hypothetical protein
LISCIVKTKPQNHPFNTGINLKEDEELPSPDNLKRIIGEHYRKNMIPIVNACASKELKAKVQHNVNTATFENIQVNDMTSNKFILED